jgi:hypothetical protein
MKQLDRWLEITFVCIVIYLVLSRANAFATAIQSIGSVYVGAGKMLQGR